MNYYLNILLYLVIAISAIKFIASMVKKRGKSNLPPGPPGIPIFGNMFSIGTKPHIALTKLSKTYGPLMSIKLGRLSAVVISSPDMAREAYKKNDLSISDRYILDAFTTLDFHHKSMGMIPYGSKWRNLRKICSSQIFSTSKLESTRMIRRKVVEDLGMYLEKCSEAGAVVDIGLAVFTTSLNLLSNTFFSVDLGDPDSEIAVEFRETARGLLAEAARPNLADFFPLLKKIDLQGVKRRAMFHLRKMIDLFNTVIEKRLEEKRVSGSKEGNDVLDALLDIIQENQDFELSNIPYLLVDLFTGGTDTTATTVEWAMTELIHNPGVMRKAQAEMNEIIGKGNPIQESDISRLPYLEAVVKESFRSHPPVPFSIPRKTVCDINLFGLTVPKDTQILLNIYGMGRDPKLWENPTSFKPERFMGSDIDVGGHHFELTPFGAGRRICPALPLATRIVPLMLAAFIHGYQWTLEGGISPEDMNLDERFGITLAKAHLLGLFQFTSKTCSLVYNYFEESVNK